MVRGSFLPETPKRERKTEKEREREREREHVDSEDTCRDQKRGKESIVAAYHDIGITVVTRLVTHGDRNNQEIRERLDLT